VSTLTSGVLAHKRIVVVLWAVLTIAGIMASGPAPDALERLRRARLGHRVRHPGPGGAPARTGPQDSSGSGVSSGASGDAPQIRPWER
jgi:hypothetical protein